MNPAHRGRAAGRGRLLAAVAASLALVSCADTTSTPAWVATHPDTAEVSFQTTAPGVCAITVQYPNDAPAAMVYLGSTYVQVHRRAHQGSPAGHDLGQSGDWHVLLQSNGDLLLVTPGDGFDYRLEPSC